MDSLSGLLSRASSVGERHSDWELCCEPSCAVGIWM